MHDANQSELPDPCVMLLNMKRSHARRARFTANFGSSSFTRIEATDWVPCFRTAYFREHPRLRNESLAPQKALILSNVYAMKHALRHNCAHALIFEDDAIPPARFRPRRDQLTKYDVVYLDARLRGRPYPLCCTGAMLYSRNALQVLSRELDWPRSTTMTSYRPKRTSFLPSHECRLDWFLYNAMPRLNLTVNMFPDVEVGMSHWGRRPNAASAAPDESPATKQAPAAAPDGFESTINAKQFVELRDDRSQHSGAGAQHAHCGDQPGELAAAPPPVVASSAPRWYDSYVELKGTAGQLAEAERLLAVANARLAAGDAAGALRAFGHVHSFAPHHTDTKPTR